MLQVDLSTLRGPELRRLLDAARERGQAALSYKILQEMEARRERDGRGGALALLPVRRRTEPRVISVDLGDPLECPDPLAEPDAEGPPTPDAEAPSEATTPPAGAPAQARRRWTGAGFAAGLAVGLGAGWWVAGIATPPAAPPAARTAAALPIVLEPALAPPIPTLGPTVVPSVVPSAVPPAAPVTVEPDLVSQETPTEPVAEPTPMEVDRTRQPPPAEAPSTPKGCRAMPTPADRTICDDPRLQRLQRELRQAYADALEAHEDRALLRQRQLAWRDARNDISEPDRLAELYEQRIRKLNAATAAARQAR